ncbi:hypothetical protein SARC_12458 [Sphaeroforma arctica JP610]|uniref:Uncharacterized protein n=1 Tax=Sphaeroforma arctica JP610 TaxID=667725 RepID=A0A0L0FG39_9EUKA|nr:hypothetical protein SARC_12458 [Sphaeroforma arctica JP610]KNC75008.1 hypothetical protein SARC_12458 [Sphaeroforma arctica JP610]|eukprot:XP_014148910.1 hypothetical protein SARC_12458 [Sphaeroforma arctica JP610]
MSVNSVHSNEVRTRSNLATAYSPTAVEDVGMGETPNKEGCRLPYMEGGSISEQADVHVSPRHSNTSIVRSCDETIEEVDDEEALSGKEHTNTTDELALSGKEHTSTTDTWVRRGSLPTHIATTGDDINTCTDIATTENSYASTQSPETKTDSHTAKVAVNKSMPDLLDRLESQPNKKAIKKRTPSMRNILRSFPTFGMGPRKRSHTGSTRKASDLSLKPFGHKHSACDRVTSFTGDIAEHDSTTRNPLSRMCTHSSTHTKHRQPAKDVDAEMDIAITESTNANTCIAYGMA